MRKPPKRTRAGIQVVEPDVYPLALSHALRHLFSELPEVEAAYLAVCTALHGDDRPHHVIGIEGSGDLSNAIQQARRVAQKHLAQGEYVDLIRIGNSALSHSLVLETEPIYRKRPPAQH